MCIYVRLEITYIDLLSAVQFLFSIDPAKANTSATATHSVIDTAIIADAKTVIAGVLEAETNKAKKGKKDEEKKEYSAVDITEATLQSLSREIKLKALAVKLYLDSNCVRKGYVLDIWNDADVFGSVDALASIPTALEPKPEPVPEGETTDNTETKIVETVKLYPPIVEVLIEMQVL